MSSSVLCTLLHLMFQSHRAIQGECTKYRQIECDISQEVKGTGTKTKHFSVEYMIKFMCPTLDTLQTFSVGTASNPAHLVSASRVQSTHVFIQRVSLKCIVSCSPSKFRQSGGQQWWDVRTTDICFWYQNENNTLNNIHSFVFYNRFRSFGPAVITYNHNDANRKVGCLSFTAKMLTYIKYYYLYRKPSSGPTVQHAIWSCRSVF